MLVAYDYIIVGGGSAGCVVAGRLAAEDRNLNILLIEAGKKVTNNINIDCPALFGELINSELDWKFQNYPRGKMLGGSSNMNACVYLRGDPLIYDQWPDGWKSKDLIPYFIKAEDCSNLPEEIVRSSKFNRGFKGPMKLSLPGDNGENINPYTKLFVQACKELGFTYFSDINNGVFQDGVSYHQFNIYKGVRHSTYKAYLEGKPNLTILCNEQVVKINFVHNKAQSVKCLSGKIFKTKGEILLCTGSICSPWLLMLSGIGERKELESLGVPCLADLPVGSSLSDHVMAPFLFKTNKNWGINHDSKRSRGQWKATKTGDLSDSGVQASLFTKSRSAIGRNDLQITFLPGVPERIHNFITLVLNKDKFKNFPNSIVSFMNMSNLKVLPRSIRNLGRFLLNRKKMNIPNSGFVLFPVVGLPYSQGKIRLKSRNINDYPDIIYHPFSDERDKNIMLDAVRLIRRIVKTSCFKELGVEEVIDKSIHYNPDSDDYILAYTQASLSQGHVACTCPMGKVVDPNLKVKGLEGLRVIDASVLPTMVNGNIQNTVIAIAEKSVDLLKK